MVVGADGHHSLVARRVKAEQYNEKPPLQVSYYTYVSSLPMEGRTRSTFGRTEGSQPGPRTTI